MLLNPNDILFFTIQFAFNDPIGKSECLNGFKKIVWVPGMARDQSKGAYSSRARRNYKQSGYGICQCSGSGPGSGAFLTPGSGIRDG
jgi:hypothetical protein